MADTFETGPLDPVVPEVTFRSFDDIDAERENIYSNAIKALSEREPLQNATHKLELADIGYDSPAEFSIAQEKDAILKRKSLYRPLKATMRLSDLAGNLVEERRLTVANVPHLTGRGTVIRNGIPYVIRNQARLRPGAYTRKKKNGGVETHFNVKPGTGRGFRVELEPESGLFKMRIDQSTTRLYPVLKSLGITDEEMKESWGDELFNKNFRAQSGKDELDLDKVAKKLGRNDLEIPVDQLPQVIKDIINRTEIDEETSELTLGERIKTLSPQILLKATRKQLDVANNKAESDNRDSQAYQSFHAAEDLVAERLKKDQIKALRTALWKGAREGSLRTIQAGLLDKNIDALFNGSGLTLQPEDNNPLDIFDLRQGVTRLGEGGIASQQSVSRDARGIQASYIGVIAPERAPESSNMGLDLRVAAGAKRGSDNKLYATVKNLRTGEMETVSARDLASKVVTFPGELGTADKRVPAIKNDNIVYVNKDEVDYEIPSANGMFSRASLLIPQFEGVKSGRLLMGARMTQQAVPLIEPEAPLVQTAEDDGTSIHSSMSKFLGARHAPAEGIVTRVTPDFVELSTKEGKKIIDLYNNYHTGRKSFMHNEALVQPGQVVKAGQLLASSNYTDKNGVMAVGRNLRTAYMTAEGDTIEDAYVVSESAAKKLGAQAMYKSELDIKDVLSTRKDDYVAIYADKFTNDQYSKLGDDGIIRIGETVKAGDPLMLGVGKKPQGMVGAVMNTPKASHSDLTQTWDHQADGIVTDVVTTKNGSRVYVKSLDTVDHADKICMRYGNKGVVVVRPDSQMPVDEEGNTIDVLVNTNGVIGRINPSTLAEQLLGKVALKTGKPYVLRAFNTPDVADFALNEAAKNGVKELETVTDPRDGRKIPGIFVGNGYVMRLTHKAEGKMSARDSGSYTSSGYPAKGGPEGAKRISLMDNSVLIAAGATNFLRDAKLIRGQRNDDYWRAIRNGEEPILPEGSIADQEFLDMLTSAGVHVQKDGTKEKLRPLLDRDVDELAKHEIGNSKTFDFESMEPIPDGLFDIGKTGGADGNMYSKIVLPEKIPHPLFIDPIQKLLGVTNKTLMAVLSGQESLNGKTGPAAVEAALKGVDVHREMEACKVAIRTGKQGQKDAAVRKLNYLAGLKKMEIQPEELMVSKIPVIPPKYRPIMSGTNTDIVHDFNYLYHDLLEAKQNYLDAKNEIGSTSEEYLTLLKAARAITGAEDPVNKEHAEQGIKGILRYAIGLGDSPKFSNYQRRVIGQSVDQVGRGVITADGTLKMDEIGMPYAMAWETYKPYIIRRLVQAGKPASEAVLAVQNRDEDAKKALLEETKVRPVAYNRAPALHQYAYFAAWPKLTDDHAIRVPYTSYAGLGADNDGDAINIHVPSTREAVQDLKDKLMPSKRLFSSGNFQAHMLPMQDYIAGMYLASQMNANEPVKTFQTVQDAKRAYARGEISARTPIRVLQG